MGEPSWCAVESLIAEVDAIPPGTRLFDILVPSRLTFEARQISIDDAVAIISDQLAFKKLHLVGCDQTAEGRRYWYQVRE